MIPPPVDRFEIVTLPVDGTSGWTGYRSVRFRSPDGRHEVTAAYESEPPHGDSYHRVAIDGHALPGLVWGCNFAWDPTSRFFVCSWMPRLFARETVVIDVACGAYFVLPEYFSDFKVIYPVIEEVRTAGLCESGRPRRFTFGGSEGWLSIDAAANV